MSSEIVDAAAFSPVVSIGVLFFAGLGLLISNIYGVPASTSMTAVGAIVGLGLATGTLNTELMFTILSAWIIAPLISLLRVRSSADICTPTSMPSSRSVASRIP